MLELFLCGTGTGMALAHDLVKNFSWLRLPLIWLHTKFNGIEDPQFEEAIRDVLATAVQR